MALRLLIFLIAGLFYCTTTAGATVTVLSAGSLATARKAHTATLLQNGLILVAGGYNGTNTVYSSAELYNPLTGQSQTVSSSMNSPRVYHTATLLKNGKVLIVGGSSGVGNAYTYLNSAEIFDPSTNSFAAAGNLNLARARHTASLLQNGKVLVTGGQDDNPGQIAGIETYDPQTNTFTMLATFGTNLRFHSATAMADGKVLLCGNTKSYIYDPSAGTVTDKNSSFGLTTYLQSSTLLPDGVVLLAGGHNSSSSHDAFYWFSGTMQYMGIMGSKRVYHSSTLLPDGRVLVCGGKNISTSTVHASCEAYTKSSNSFAAVATLLNARDEHTATLLPGGKVVFIGGGGQSGTALQQVEMIDVYDTSVANTGTMVTARAYHHMTMLADNRVLHNGGSTASSTLASSEIYDPQTATYTATGAMNSRRTGHSSTLLQNGTVLVTGGGYSGGLGGLFNYLSSAEIFDPATGTYTAVPATMTSARSGHSAILLSNGKVLLAGGRNGQSNALASAELFDPATNSFTATGSMPSGRTGQAAILLTTGNALLTGGMNSSNQALSSTVVYNAATGQFSAEDNMTSARARHAMTTVPGGNILITGGYDGSSMLSSAEMYSPVSGEFFSVGSMHTARADHAAVTLQNGKVLVAGGYNNSFLASTELFDPVSEMFVESSPMASPRQYLQAVLLADGKVLFSGGKSESTGYVGQSQLFDPASTIPAQRPRATITEVSSSTPGTISFKGSNFAGDSEAGSGSTNNSSAAVPVLQLQKLDSGALVAIPPLSSASWSSVLFSIDQAKLDGLLLGQYQATIAASGISSKAWTVQLMPLSSLSPATFNFGNVNSGGSSAGYLYTVSNPGLRSLTITGVSIGGANGNAFFKQNDSCSSTVLAPLSSCQFKLYFTPQSAGAKSAVITVNSNSAAGPATATVTGTGVDVFYSLTITKTGTGLGTVHSDGGSISWNNTIGTATYSSGRGVTLTATAEATSSFSGWSGEGCSGTGTCYLVMDANRSVTAGFSMHDYVRLGSATTPYASLNLAYAAAQDNAVIKALGREFVEDLTLDQPVTVILQGGYVAGFGSRSGSTTLYGMLTVGQGSLVVDNLVVQ